MMKIVNVAWHVLSDAGRRAAYDAERIPASRPIPAPAPSEHAAIYPGPAPGKPAGRVVDYGRYKGWSLGEIARVDPNYLEWLRDAPGYRWLRPDVDEILEGAKPKARARQQER